MLLLLLVQLFATILCGVRAIYPHKLSESSNPNVAEAAVYANVNAKKYLSNVKANQILLNSFDSV